MILSNKTDLSHLPSILVFNHIMNLDKDEILLKRRLSDLANTAYERGICLFSDYLNLNEQSVFLSIKHELPMIKYFAYGGFNDAERKILCFCGNNSTDDITDIEYPISCLKITPISSKFSDSLTHRDYLGAILNLGINRRKIGDILSGNNEGYIFCTASISSFIIDQLTKVKHTMIKVSLADKQEFNYEPALKELHKTVSSERLDSILAAAFNESRNSITNLIAAGKVFVNSKLVLSNSYILKENDIVSARGIGKFKYAGTTGTTKKGRYSVLIKLYIA